MLVIFQNTSQATIDATVLACFQGTELPTSAFIATANVSSLTVYELVSPETVTCCVTSIAYIADETFPMFLSYMLSEVCIACEPFAASIFTARY